MFSCSPFAYRRCLLVGWLLMLLACVQSPGFAQRSSDPTGSASDPLREQTIYIPYDQLRDVFEREGRGVFLPYEQFQKLWQEARSAKPPVANDKSPIEAMLVSADNVATIEKQIMLVRATITVELLRDGWQKIPLQLNDAAILSAKIDNETARILHDPAAGYSLLFHNKEGKAVKKTVELEYAKAYEKTPGQNSFSVQAPQAPINQWRIRIAEPGVKVQVEPMLATSETPQQNGTVDGTSAGTELLAFVGATPSVRIRWVPKSEGATGMAPLANVQVQHKSIIEEGMIRTSVQLAYTIDRSELAKLSIAIPADQKVINVFDPNVRKWIMESSADEHDASTKLVVELFEPARTTQNLLIELETKLDPQSSSTPRVQPLVCLDANRQQGVVAIRVGEGLRAEPVERQGLLQMNSTELPAPLAQEAWTFAYRFTSVPFDLKLKLDKVLPSIRIEQLVEVVVEPESITLELSTTHKIENAGVFQMEFELPPDFELLQVVGRSGNGIEPASIEAYRFATDTKDKLVISLNRRALGKIGTHIRLRKKIADPNLIDPTGVASAITIPVPRSTGGFVQWLEGIVVIYAQESLRINPVEKVGVREGVPNEARAIWNSDCLQRHPGTSESIVFAHAMEPVRIGVDVERKRPFVTVRQLVQVMVEPGVVRHTYTLETHVQYSSVTALRLDVPEAIAKDLRIETPGIRQTTISPATLDLKDGYVAWQLASDKPWLGERSVVLSRTSQMDGLDVGKSVDLTIPALFPRGVDQSWGQIVLSRKDSIDLQSSQESSGLRPIDPRYDISGGMSFPDAARAFEFQGDWQLKLTATRYALEQVKQTSIERAFIRTVVTRSKRIGVHAIYRMRNGRQRLSLNLPEGTEFDSQPLLINGVNASLERGSGNQLYIPMAGFDPARPIVVELRYTVPGDQQQIDIPSFPDVPAVQAVYLGVFLPKERILLASHGPWTEEFEMRNTSGWRYEPVCYRSPQQLVPWAKEDVSVVSSVDFQTDGTFYLYSSLSPIDSPAGSLRLRVVDERWWNVGIIGLLLVLGVVLLRMSWQIKLIGVATITAFAIGVGIFAPLLASQWMSTSSYIGLAMIVLLWGTQSVIQTARSAPRHWSTPEKPQSQFATEPSITHPNEQSTNSSPPAEKSPETTDEQGGTSHV